MATSFLEFFLCILMCSMICTQSRSLDIHQELTTISENLIPCSIISTPTTTPSSTFLASNQNLKGSLVHALFNISDSSVYHGTNHRSNATTPVDVEDMIHGVKYVSAGGDFITGCQTSGSFSNARTHTDYMVRTCICLTISYLLAGSARETENSEVGPLESSDEVVGPRAENPVVLPTYIRVVQNFLRPLPNKLSNYPMLYCLRDPDLPPVYAALVYCYHYPEARVGVCDGCLQDHWYLRHGCNWATVHETARAENRLLPGFPWPGSCAVYYSYARIKSVNRHTEPTERVGYVIVLEQ